MFPHTKYLGCLALFGFFFPSHTQNENATDLKWNLLLYKNLASSSHFQSSVKWRVSSDWKQIHKTLYLVLALLHSKRSLASGIYI